MQSELEIHCSLDVVLEEGNYFLSVKTKNDIQKLYAHLGLPDPSQDAPHYATQITIPGRTYGVTHLRDLKKLLFPNFFNHLRHGGFLESLSGRVILGEDDLLSRIGLLGAHSGPKSYTLMFLARSQEEMEAMEKLQKASTFSPRGSRTLPPPSQPPASLPEGNLQLFGVSVQRSMGNHFLRVSLGDSSKSLTVPDNFWGSLSWEDLKNRLTRAGLPALGSGGLFVTSRGNVPFDDKTLLTKTGFQPPSFKTSSYDIYFPVSGDVSSIQRTLSSPKLTVVSTTATKRDIPKEREFPLTLKISDEQTYYLAQIDTQNEGTLGLSIPTKSFQTLSFGSLKSRLNSLPKFSNYGIYQSPQGDIPFTDDMKLNDVGIHAYRGKSGLEYKLIFELLSQEVAQPSSQELSVMSARSRAQSVPSPYQKQVNQIELPDVQAQPGELILDIEFSGESGYYFVNIKTLNEEPISQQFSVSFTTMENCTMADLRKNFSKLPPLLPGGFFLTKNGKAPFRDSQKISDIGLKLSRRIKLVYRCLFLLQSESNTAPDTDLVASNQRLSQQSISPSEEEGDQLVLSLVFSAGFGGTLYITITGEAPNFYQKYDWQVQDSSWSTTTLWDIKLRIFKLGWPFVKRGGYILGANGKERIEDSKRLSLAGLKPARSGKTNFTLYFYVGEPNYAIGSREADTISKIKAQPPPPLQQMQKSSPSQSPGLPTRTSLRNITLRTIAKEDQFPAYIRVTDEQTYYFVLIEKQDDAEKSISFTTPLKSFTTMTMGFLKAQLIGRFPKFTDGGLYNDANTGNTVPFTDSMKLSEIGIRGVRGKSAVTYSVIFEEDRSTETAESSLSAPTSSLAPISPLPVISSPRVSGVMNPPPQEEPLVPFTAEPHQILVNLEVSGEANSYFVSMSSPSFKSESEEAPPENVVSVQVALPISTLENYTFADIKRLFSTKTDPLAPGCTVVARNGTKKDFRDSDRLRDSNVIFYKRNKTSHRLLFNVKSTDESQSSQTTISDIDKLTQSLDIKDEEELKVAVKIPQGYGPAIVIGEGPNFYDKKEMSLPETLWEFKLKLFQSGWPIVHKGGEFVAPHGIENIQDHKSLSSIGIKSSRASTYTLIFKIGEPDYPIGSKESDALLKLKLSGVTLKKPSLPNLNITPASTGASLRGKESTTLISPRIQTSGPTDLKDRSTTVPTRNSRTSGVRNRISLPPPNIPLEKQLPLKVVVSDEEAFYFVQFEIMNASNQETPHPDHKPFSISIPTKSFTMASVEMLKTQLGTSLPPVTTGGFFINEKGEKEGFVDYMKLSDVGIKAIRHRKNVTSMIVMEYKEATSTGEPPKEDTTAGTSQTLSQPKPTTSLTTPRQSQSLRSPRGSAYTANPELVPIPITTPPQEDELLLEMDVSGEEGSFFLSFKGQSFYFQNTSQVSLPHSYLENATFGEIKKLLTTWPKFLPGGHILTKQGIKKWSDNDKLTAFHFHFPRRSKSSFNMLLHLVPGQRPEPEQEPEAPQTEPQETPDTPVIDLSAYMQNQ